MSLASSGGCPKTGHDGGLPARRERAPEALDEALKTRSRPVTVFHTRCRWPGCECDARVAWYGCAVHWFRIPRLLRDRLVRAFRPGQEERPGSASLAWREADAEIQRWIGDSEAPARLVA